MPKCPLALAAAVTIDPNLAQSLISYPFCRPSPTLKGLSPTMGTLFGSFFLRNLTSGIAKSKIDMTTLRYFMAVLTLPYYSEFALFSKPTTLGQILVQCTLHLMVIYKNQAVTREVA
jgi:hypothetical protein